MAATAAPVRSRRTAEGTGRPGSIFAVALPDVGVFDMLRFHKFTIGWAWVPEYGSSEDEAMFQVLYAYSPLHRIREGFGILKLAPHGGTLAHHLLCVEERRRYDRLSRAQGVQQGPTADLIPSTPGRYRPRLKIGTLLSLTSIRPRSILGNTTRAVVLAGIVTSRSRNRSPFLQCTSISPYPVPTEAET